MQDRQQMSSRGVNTANDLIENEESDVGGSLNNSKSDKSYAIISVGGDESHIPHYQDNLFAPHHIHIQERCDIHRFFVFWPIFIKICIIQYTV